MSLPEIDPNELAKDGIEAALYFLEDAIKGVAKALEFTPNSQMDVVAKHPMLIGFSSLLAFLDVRATEHGRLMESLLEALQEIAEGVDMLCTLGFPAPESATACQAEPETAFLLKGQQPEPMYDALKAGFQHLHPDCSIEQHAAAMDYFARLVGL